VNGAWPVAPTGANLRRFSVVRSGGQWQAVFEPPGNEPVAYFGDLAARPDGGIDATFTIPRDGRSVTVAQAGRSPRTFQLSYPLFDTTRNFGVISLISPFATVALTRLSVFEAPSGHPAAPPLPSLKAAAPPGLSVGIWTGAMILDRNMQPKPAYFALRDLYKQRVGLT